MVNGAHHISLPRSLVLGILAIRICAENDQRKRLQLTRLHSQYRVRRGLWGQTSIPLDSSLTPILEANNVFTQALICQAVVQHTPAGHLLAIISCSPAKLATYSLHCLFISLFLSVCINNPPIGLPDKNSFPSAIHPALTSYRALGKPRRYKSQDLSSYLTIKNKNIKEPFKLLYLSMIRALYIFKKDFQLKIFGWRMQFKSFLSYAKIFIILHKFFDIGLRNLI